MVTRLTLATVLGVVAAGSLAGAAMMSTFPRQVPATPSPSVQPAIDAVLELFKRRPVVALGDVHGLAQEEAFYSALVRDPRFAQDVGNVVVEFGGEASQGIIDRYLAGERVSATELRRVWTETAGWIPGPTRLGFINFYANARAANLKLPPERRIKVWLGDPAIDWSKINSRQDLQPYIARRDDNFLRIIGDEILKKHKKTLLIIGTGHLAPLGPQQLSAQIRGAYPGALAIVSPFTGYIEPECNARFVAQARDWPTPAIVGPVEGTSLKSEMQLPGCSYVPEKGTAAGPDTSSQVMLQSGSYADAILYLGPPDTLNQSPIDPAIYLDPDYFNEESRRSACCTSSGKPLDWDQLVQQNSVVPKSLRNPR